MAATLRVSFPRRNRCRRRGVWIIAAAVPFPHGTCHAVDLRGESARRPPIRRRAEPRRAIASRGSPRVVESGKRSRIEEDAVVDGKQSVVTAGRYASGMTFDQYVSYVGTPENLAREASMGGQRRDWSGYLRTAYERARLTDHQTAAIRWLASQPNGPAKILVIAEEWSSDCRRDVPVLARLAEAGGLELRIFRRDGKRFSGSHRPTLAEAPDSNADLMAEFLNEKNAQTWQSIPVAVFYTRDLEYLYHYVEYPAIYHKDRVTGHIRSPKPGETAEQGRERGNREFFALQDSPFFQLWACAGVDEMLSALHERLVVGSLP
jgi:thioredoxin family protein